MDGSACDINVIAGQDEMLSLMLEFLDITGVFLKAHSDEGELPSADTHVVLQCPASAWRAHTQHLLFVLVAEEGLRGPLAEVVLLNERLPLVLVERVRLVLGQVTLQEGVVRRGV